jgi:hypothetical protein
MMGGSMETEVMDSTNPRLSLVVTLLTATIGVWSLVAMSVVQAAM